MGVAYEYSTVRYRGRWKVQKQLVKVAKSLGIGTGTLQRISKGRAMSPRGAQ